MNWSLYNDLLRPLRSCHQILFRIFPLCHELHPPQEDESQSLSSSQHFAKCLCERKASGTWPAAHHAFKAKPLTNISAG